MSNQDLGPDQKVEKYRKADKEDLLGFLDQIDGSGKGTAQEMKDRSEKKSKKFAEVKDELGLNDKPVKGPGLLSRIGKAFRSFGATVSNFFKPKPAAPQLDTAAVDTRGEAKAAQHDQTDSLSEDNGLNVTYTRAQGRQAAAQLGANDAVDFKGARAKMAQASAQTANFEPDMHDDVKDSLNVTMTRSEAMEAAKALTKAHEAGRTHDTGHSL